jgi:diacylglycerol kinase (ATP)
MARRPVNGSPNLPPRRLLVIANPISGGGRSQVVVPRLCAELHRLGVASETAFTRAAGDAAALAATAATTGFDAVIACGGDGTVNEVLNGLPAGLPLPVGVLPVGTANVLAAGLGLPHRPELAAAVFAAGTERPLAVGRAAGRRFLLFCGTGLDGAVVRRLSQVRTGTLGKLKWTGPILHTVRHWPRYALRVTFADGSVWDDLASVLVTRSRNYGGWFRLVPEVDVDSGLLHVLGFRRRSRTAWAWQGLRAMLGTLRANDALQVRTTTALTIEGSAPYQIDGDYGGDAPVAIELLPQHLRLLAPTRRT